MERIGFVGVGLMGHGMAANLLKAGYPVTVIAHRNRAPVEDLVAQGAKEAADLAALARDSDIVHICAPGSPQVEAIVDVLAAEMAAGGVVIDCSTSNPVSSEALAAKLDAKGIGWADAPLGGTPVQAEAGELAAMVGATPEIFARVEPVIASWAGTIAHIGGPAAGHRMKLLNNFLAMGYGALYAEALALAEKTGLGTETFDRVIRGSRMDCGFYQTFMGYAVEGNREAHKFTLTNALKDMTYLSAMAGGAGVANPMGAAVRNSYMLAVNTGGDGGDDYVPHLVDFVAKANGITR
ncbi:NAD(P)-dependent oxidoreductase [Jannaschia seohaensis]|uniref:3-hydroxyisobutyrate dehydrogenase n=1 Tax=Jannaschia seohaensis TaxID=475081 RepID=A0A2Y9A326_9RHOB|nr:NAD(P)-dependent oxidoreductase [Jannaschia seohaensis]PWJ22018.1 3-hydroxyisobutyrate dehydrogenase-like beta-hydroxyacid dehydrogenase [Jannaschia seohaensis]SSA38296.1 3-hydroxyisobutyrate dehydrogenase [Jannaschia seohaensis]